MRAEKYVLISPSGFAIAAFDRAELAGEIRAWRREGHRVHRWRDKAHATRFWVYTEVGGYYMRPEHDADK